MSQGIECRVKNLYLMPAKDRIRCMNAMAVSNDELYRTYSIRTMSLNTTSYARQNVPYLMTTTDMAISPFLVESNIRTFF
jgi:hypothetical protein